jgi:UDP-glucose 4-epimerase
MVADTCPPPDAPAERVVFVPYEEAYSAGFEDMQRRIPDLTRIRQAVGWQPRLSLARILRDVLESMR